MKLLAGLLALSTLISPLLGQVELEQKTYVLAKKGHPLPLKERFKVSQLMSMGNGKLKVSFSGQEMTGTVSTSKQAELVYDFLSEDKIRVNYEKGRDLKKSSMMGQEQDEEKIHPAEGTTILLEKKEGKWVGKLEAGKVDAVGQEEFDEAVEKLEKEFNIDEASTMYGSEPRKIGESWDVDPSLMPGMDDFEVKGGNLTMTFLEVKQFQGELCAVLKTTFVIDAEMTEDKMEGMAAKITGDGRIVRSLTHLTDYKFVGEMRMAISGDMEIQPGANAKMSINADMKIEMRAAKAESKAEGK